MLMNSDTYNMYILVIKGGVEFGWRGLKVWCCMVGINKRKSTRQKGEKGD